MTQFDISGLELHWYNPSLVISTIAWPLILSMMTSSNGNISASLALCAGNSPVTGEIPSQRLMTQSLDVSFDLRLNKPLVKQSWGWWFETPLLSLWRHCNDIAYSYYWWFHYSDVIISANASQTTGVSIAYQTVCLGVDKRTNQSSATLAFVRGVQRWPVNSPHKGSVTRKKSFHLMVSSCITSFAASQNLN